jgi:dephospho-CoA kinase
MGLRIGLTGGIGSGKSTVAGLLAAHGACVIDADALSRRSTAPGGAALPALRAAFGDAVIGADGGMDRPRMRALAFADPAARATLEGIVHPLVRAAMARDAAASTAPVTVFDIPLLVETGAGHDRFDRVLVVDCREATQVDRVVRRSGWTADAVRTAIAQQAPRAARLALADDVIVNDGLTLEQLAAAVDALWVRWNAG